MNRVVDEIRADAGGVRHPDDVAERYRANGKDDRRDGRVYDVPRLCTSQTTSKSNCRRHSGSPECHEPIRKTCSGSGLQPTAWKKLRIRKSATTLVRANLLLLVSANRL